MVPALTVHARASAIVRRVLPFHAERFPTAEINHWEDLRSRTALFRQWFDSHAQAVFFLGNKEP